jgi:hypothetical protein
MVLFVCLISRIFQLVFLAEIMFFFHNKSTNNTFQLCFFSETNGAIQDAGGAGFKRCPPTRPAKSTFAENTVQLQVPCGLTSFGPPNPLDNTISSLRTRKNHSRCRRS